MAALELVAEMHREEITELRGDARKANSNASVGAVLPPNSTEAAESPSLEKKQADLANEKLGQGS